MKVSEESPIPESGWNSVAASFSSIEPWKEPGRIVVFAALFGFVYLLLQNASSVSQSAFESQSFLLSFVSEKLQGNGVISFAIILVLTGYLLVRPTWDWKGFAEPVFTRVITSAALVLVAWYLVFLPFNFYTNEAYWIDRGTILFLVAVSLWRPAFCLPFILVSLGFVQQSNLIGAGATGFISIPIHIVVLCAVSTLFTRMTGKKDWDYFLPFTLCLTALHYFYAGLGKFRPNWLIYNDITYVFGAGYSNGWLSFLSVESFESIFRVLRIFAIPLKILTLFLELGSFLIFWNRRLAYGFLAGWACFHVGILAFSGLNFLLWIIIDLTILISLYFLLREKPDSDSISILGKAALSGLVVVGFVWANPVKLSWFDSPFTYSYRFYAERKDGTTQIVPHTFFRPYNYPLALGQLHSLSKRPVARVVAGAAMNVDGPDLVALKSKNDLRQFETKRSSYRYSERESKRIVGIIKRSIESYQNNDNPGRYIGSLSTPPNFLYHVFRREDQNPEDWKSLSIVQETYFYGNGKYEKIRKAEVAKIDLLD